MLKVIPVAAFIGVFLLTGCAPREARESTVAENQKILRENESRLRDLESSVAELNTQVEQLNSRSYEVRTGAGKKTSMRVVPVNTASAAGPNAGVAPEAVVVPPPPAPLLPLSNEPPAAQAAPKPAAQAKASPRGRVIDPKSKPSPLTGATVAHAAPAPAAAQAPARKAPATPANAGAAGRIGQPETTAGPSGSISHATDDLALPPAALPDVPNQMDEGTAVTGHATNAVATPARKAQEATVAVPTGNAPGAVPLPLAQEPDLSLPPESATPVAATPAPASTPAPAARQAARPAVQASKAPAKGEEAAYRAALNAARSGRTAEALRLFRNFQQQYPNGRYAANADYWIGECLYSEGKYKDALSQFQNVNSAYPSHHKNADALLKAAITMNRLGDKAGAQEKFRALLANFPNSDAARRARAMGAGR